MGCGHSFCSLIIGRCKNCMKHYDWQLSPTCHWAGKLRLQYPGYFGLTFVQCSVRSALRTDLWSRHEHLTDSQQNNWPVTLFLPSMLKPVSLFEPRHSYCILHSEYHGILNDERAQCGLGIWAGCPLDLQLGGDPELSGGILYPTWLRNALAFGKDVWKILLPPWPNNGWTDG